MDESITRNILLNGVPDDFDAMISAAELIVKLERQVESLTLGLEGEP